MTLFQALSVAGLGALWLRDLHGLMRGQGLWRLRLVRCAVWLLTAAAIAWPGLVQTTARFLGVGRGADVVLYGFALAFLATTFYFYARYVRLQRQISQLVRHLAIQDARRGGAEREPRP